MDHLESIIQEVTSLKKFYKKISDENIQLKQQIQQIFQEEEIKKCPSYELLKETYSVVVFNKTKNSKSEYAELPNPYMPAWAHKKLSKRQQPKQTEVNTPKKPVQKPIKIKTPKLATSPNLESPSECMLLDEPTAKKSPSNAQSQSQSQSPQEPICVEQIEINDVIYLLHENRIYNKKTGLPVGKIDVGVVILNDVPITLKTKKIIHISDNQYRDRDNNVYELHKDLSIAKAIGEYDNGEVLVFA